MSVPKLRFKGFIDSWKRTKVENVASLINGRAYKKDELLTKGKYPVLRVGNFFTNDEWYYSDLELSDEKYAESGDLLYAWSASFGPKIWSGNKVIFHYHIWRVMTQPNIDKYFLNTWFQRDVERIKSQQNGSTMVHVTKGEMERREIFIPKLDEQKRISGLFKYLDKKIELQRAKVEALKVQKKGLLKKIFSRELRFKDENGEEFPDWEGARFGDCIRKIVGGGTPSRAEETFYGGNIPWVTVKDLRDEKYIGDALEYITELGLENSSANLAEIGDLIIPTRMAVGRVLIAINPIAINQDLKAVTLKEGINIEFMYYQLLSLSKRIEGLGTGSTVSGIGLHDLKAIPIYLPTLKEQEKISTILRILDKKIVSEKNKVLLLQKQKKGLMQQMFV
ncbi:restriction endonuclease subunit S [Bhargavaea ginsengi]|uniref:restriction endonuclease subunit S n=1 Tax=Bhargavaea ginsengi TaxID=426757 RepID=UPI00203E72CE|nr:restriction endonuclease subunit S [Bhargavaea ginsengi]MCM3089302.1 restriction endonuclease subunit S [Bhargavaea ginsengi]